MSIIPAQLICDFCKKPPQDPEMVRKLHAGRPNTTDSVDYDICAICFESSINLTTMKRTRTRRAKTEKKKVVRKKGGAADPSQTV